MMSRTNERLRLSIAAFKVAGTLRVPNLRTRSVRSTMTPAPATRRTMKLEYVPLLQTQCELQGMPRNYERFKQYLRTITGGRQTMELPSLGIMNPMGKDHVTVLLDQLLAMDADGIAARTIAEASARVADDPGEFKVALVIADDLMGGWTNRYDYEYKIRFPGGWASTAGPKLPRWLTHF